MMIMEKERNDQQKPILITSEKLLLSHNFFRYLSLRTIKKKNNSLIIIVVSNF